MPDRPALFDELQTLTTETRNPRTMQIDVAPLAEVVRLLHEEDQIAVDAVTPELPYVAQAVEIVEDAFRTGGRLFYCGAGTSGRLGVLDAAECPPTFGTPPDLVQGLIAGGKAAMFVAQEGAEDHESNGAAALDEAGVTDKDVVCGIAASRRTPYVVGAVKRAREIGARTLFVTCNPRSQFTLDVDVAICPDVGPEPIMGSTRMKSGTATKLVLNMISTATMIRLGKVYENMMVDLQMTNLKLVERSKRIVMTATGVNYDEAAATLDAAGGHVKTALVMLLAGVDAEAARERIEQGGGFVRHAIAGTTPD
ncbi:N-acetylmuramic acid 6-phosphate etherase [Rubrivirga marina]|uniref:N-acetylmuramic acid 6-phosphate etherase n=1 Tax=Rubrivirga marina TaxID=1196024 RepID=A0A271IXI2_9BACT|nr:N-acetylmuramic acid 6-phosphate etherase [Rubrivirga marina]PAP75524.1 N-acetylmuramic acid 6-phosphate etherase [Rubrivirga marina]